MPEYKVKRVKLGPKKGDSVKSFQPRSAIGEILKENPIQIRIENTENGRTWDMIITEVSEDLERDSRYRIWLKYHGYSEKEIPEAKYVRRLDVLSKEVGD